MKEESVDRTPVALRLTETYSLPSSQGFRLQGDPTPASPAASGTPENCCGPELGNPGAQISELSGRLVPSGTPCRRRLARTPAGRRGGGNKLGDDRFSSPASRKAKCLKGIYNRIRKAANRNVSCGSVVFFSSLPLGEPQVWSFGVPLVAPHPQRKDWWILDVIDRTWARGKKNTPLSFLRLFCKLSKGTQTGLKRRAPRALLGTLEEKDSVNAKEVGYAVTWMTTLDDGPERSISQ
ncbi:uncharacterized protein LOC119932064 [Tachyglossus aculeatus]|uniref:uncharacterized protein LOC119932064 n=1 Tax=Tachyglossus aculeatus TaxID=9261 RepID=UPI0018F58C8C|nr:uncharacterized protein LOC119932064 [Tachyglossus aculeatus]